MNNGNVVQLENRRDTNRTQNFTYDELNRIRTATTQATSGTHAWGLQFGYDVWANLLSAAVTQGSAPQLSLGAAVNNRISGYCYDAAGNLLIEGPCGATLTHTYDAENRITTTAGVTYTYDGDGKRVKKDQAGGTTHDRLYWTGGGSDALAESDLAGAISEEYIFFGGKRIARRIVATGVVFYYFADHLGTSRAILQAGTTSPCFDADYYPFGGERTPVTNTCPQNYKFTGKERDAESGLDYFGARYYASSGARFLSPDPENAGSLEEDPQRWNGYSYARNNPLLFTDPEGTDVRICIDGSDCYSVTDAAYKELLGAQQGRQGISLPEGTFPSGEILCGGTKCGTAQYFEQGLADDYVVPAVVAAVGGLVKAGLKGLFASGAGNAAKEAAARAAASAAATGTKQGLLQGSKAAMLQAVESGLVSGVQKAAVKRTIQRATSKSEVVVETLANGSVRVTTKRAGANGHQAIETMIDASGARSSVIQKAYDAAGNLVHVDPKFP